MQPPDAKVVGRVKATFWKQDPNNECKPGANFVLQDCASRSVFPEELAVKTLSLKTPCALAARKSKIKLKLSWKLLLCWLAFLVLECALQILEENKHEQVY
ncbi:hypothetical protein STEG23_010682 [Scotinomys teguina]